MPILIALIIKNGMNVQIAKHSNTIATTNVITILASEAYRKYIRKVCVGGIDKRQINLDQVEDFPIILPDYDKQVEFSDFVQQIDKSKVVGLKIVS